MAIDGEEIKKISELTLSVTVLKNLSGSKAGKLTPHFFIDRYKKDLNKDSFLLNSLRTSLGSFWETIAEEFAKREGYNVYSPKEFKKSNTILEATNKVRAEFTTNRKAQTGETNRSWLNEKLNKIYKNSGPGKGKKAWPSGDGVDLYFEKDGKWYIFDIKTVQLNAAGGNKFDRQLIEWICHKKHQLGKKCNAKDIIAGYIFPYNSKGDHNSHTDWMADQGGKAKPMTDDEIWAGNKFWKFITGHDNALDKIFEGIDSALENSLVKDSLDEMFVKLDKNPTAEKLDEAANKITKKFVSYLFPDIEFSKKMGDQWWWKHKGETDCTFSRSINTICDQKKGWRIGLKKFEYEMEACKCKDKTCKKKVKTIFD